MCKGQDQFDSVVACQRDAEKGHRDDLTSKVVIAAGRSAVNAYMADKAPAECMKSVETATPVTIPLTTPRLTRDVRHVPFRDTSFATKNSEGCNYAGCQCGADTTITIPEPPAGNVGQPLLVKYDGSNVCRGCGFTDFSGTLRWTPMEKNEMVTDHDNASQPGIAGVVSVIYDRPGSYPLSAEFTARCNNNGETCSCTVSGTTTVTVR